MMATATVTVQVFHVRLWRLTIALLVVAGPGRWWRRASVLAFICQRAERR